jgi:hypothetical protein
MCIVIDINVIPLVFTTESNKYSPIKEWITIGKGKLVYGGTKYNSELKGMTKHLIFLNRLKKAGRIPEMDNNEVDNQENRLKKLISKNDFNDQHIIAIIIVSGCKLVCTEDKESHKYIKKRDLYPKNFDLPNIYSSKINLSDKKYYADICKPASKIKIPLMG